MPLLLPPWFNTPRPTPHETRRIQQRYMIKSAALYFSPDGKLETLAAGLGRTYSTIAQMWSEQKGVITAQLAVDIENLVGREFITRDMLRPDLFKVDEK